MLGGFCREGGSGALRSACDLTLPALQSACEVLFLVCGSAKRDAMARVLAGEDLPAARVRPVGRLRWLVDRVAAPEDAL